MQTDRFTIRNKATGELFAGFDRDGAAVWTCDVSRAWRHDRLFAQAQALCLHRIGIPAQQKVIAL